MGCHYLTKTLQVSICGGGDSRAHASKWASFMIVWAPPFRIRPIEQGTRARLLIMLGELPQAQRAGQWVPDPKVRVEYSVA
eukprot:5378373-Amphidinium_carterae.1